jgi:hypothetical protein
MKASKTMTASDAYLAALRETAGLLPMEQEQKRSAEKKQKSKRLAGGCLLYRFPKRKAQVCATSCDDARTGDA